MPPTTGGHSSSARFSTPTRTRTRNAQLEAGNDFHFTIGAHVQSNQAEGKGVEPSSHVSENRLSRAARPTVSGYLPSPLPVDPPGIELAGFPSGRGQHAALVSSRWTMRPYCSVDRRGVEPPGSPRARGRLAEPASSHWTSSPCRSVDLMGVEPTSPTLQGSVASSGMQAHSFSSRGPSGN